MINTQKTWDFMTIQVNESVLYDFVLAKIQCIVVVFRKRRSPAARRKRESNQSYTTGFQKGCQGSRKVMNRTEWLSFRGGIWLQCRFRDRHEVIFRRKGGILAVSYKRLAPEMMMRMRSLHGVRFVPGMTFAPGMYFCPGMWFTL